MCTSGCAGYSPCTAQAHDRTIPSSRPLAVDDGTPTGTARSTYILAWNSNEWLETLFYRLWTTRPETGYVINSTPCTAIDGERAPIANAVNQGRSTRKPARHKYANTDAGGRRGPPNPCPNNTENGPCRSAYGSRCAVTNPSTPWWGLLIQRKKFADQQPTYFTPEGAFLL